MAADEPYILLLSLDGAGAPFRQGIDAEDLRLSFGSQHNRKNHILDTLIEKQWGAAVARNPRTFDGSKFRLDGITWVEGGCAVELRLGLTSYKEYMGTNRLEDAQFLQLRRDGEESHGDACAHLSNALGCEALLLTSDRQVVLLRRSAAVGTHGGLYNGPSGHPEPGSAGLPKDGVAALGATVGGEEVDVVRRELFKSVFCESVLVHNRRSWTRFLLKQVFHTTPLLSRSSLGAWPMLEGNPTCFSSCRQRWMLQPCGSAMTVGRRRVGSPTA
mmetsp:Transcript_75193/g.243394  ORF Transcript_75193/g.243394 Transcript_75193/m.243394 type:complete len:273 (-) Transcript_75193:304-1122(-)